MGALASCLDAVEERPGFAHDRRPVRRLRIVGDAAMTARASAPTMPAGRCVVVWGAAASLVAIGVGMVLDIAMTTGGGA